MMDCNEIQQFTGCQQKDKIQIFYLAPISLEIKLCLGGSILCNLNMVELKSCSAVEAVQYGDYRERTQNGSKF